MDDLAVLLAHPGAPGLVHLHHPHHPSSAIRPELAERCKVVRLDAVEHHTQRLVYAGALARLSVALGKDIEDTDKDGREVLSWDAFARGLRALWDAYIKGKTKGKGKGRANAKIAEPVPPDQDNGQIVLLFTKAERLKAVLGPEWTAMTRLAELTGVPATVVLCSQMPWDDLRPVRGDAPEPVHVYLEPLRRDGELRVSFQLTPEIVSLLLPGSQHPLYPRFVDLLIATVGHLAPTSPPAEIDYVAGALWPLYTATLPPHAEMTLLGKSHPDPEHPPAPLEVTVKLLTDLKHQLGFALAAASESLLSRQAGRAEFTRALAPFDADGVPRPMSERAVPQLPPLELPLAARFLLVAAYCASYNPAKSDVRLFGRGTGPDGRRGRRGAVRRAGYGRTRLGKVPQRLLGPRPFPLDRLLAMFSSLYAEHAPRPPDLEAAYERDVYHNSALNPLSAADMDRRRERELELDQRWEDEVDHLAHSTKLWGLIPELESQGLLHRTSPVDRLDNVTLRCEIDYDTAKNLARDLKITLDDYLYELTT